MQRRLVSVCVMLSWMLGLFGLALPASAYTYKECANPVTFQQNNVACLLACSSAISNTGDPANFIGACAACNTGALLSISPLLGTAISAGCTGEALAAAATAVEKAAKAVNTALCEKGPLGCCLEEVSPGEGSEKRGRLVTETCEGKPPVFYGDCVCLIGNALAPPISNLSYDACSAKCTEQKGSMDASQGVGRHPPPEGAGTAGAQPNINALCWAPDQCEASLGSFVGVDLACPAGQGKCRAPEPTIELSNPILGATTVTGIRSYVNLAFRFLLGAAIIAAAVVFVWAGVKYIFGSSAGSTTSAKESMTNAVIGLVLLICSVAILRTLNPATVRYDQLDVFMVNKILFSDEFFCREVKPRDASKPIQFADAGEPSGKIPYDQAKFEIPVEETLCGKEYYPEQFVGRRCTGSKCPEKGRVCLSCKGGYTECGEQKEGFACVRAVMAGTVSWASDAQPKKIYLLGICNFIQPASGQKFNSTSVANSVPTALDTDLSAVEGEAGTAGYVYGGGKDDLAALENACASRGGLRGVALGVIYKEPRQVSGAAVAGAAVVGTAGAAAGGYGGVLGGCTGGIVVAGALGSIVPVAGTLIGAGIGCIVGAVAGGTAGAGVGGLAGGAAGGYAGATTINDVAIVTKKDCGNTGTSVLSGYADGTVTSFDSTDMKTAIYCGARAGGQATAFNGTFYQNNLWTPEELKKAMTLGEAIECNFGFTALNAPPDPGTHIMGGCAASWCPKVDLKCNN